MKTPDANQVYSDMESMAKALRLQDSRMDLFMLGREIPLLSGRHISRTYLGSNGVTTEKASARFVLGCGHQIESMSQIGGICASNKHGKKPEDHMVCRACLLRCDHCGRQFCRAHLRQASDQKLYCSKCRAVRLVGKSFSMLGAIFLMFLFNPEPASEEIE